jgi:hypothetical protein
VISVDDPHAEGRESALQKSPAFPRKGLCGFPLAIVERTELPAKGHQVEINPLERAKLLIAGTLAESLPNGET